MFVFALLMTLALSSLLAFVGIRSYVNQKKEKEARLENYMPPKVLEADAVRTQETQDKVEAQQNLAHRLIEAVEVYQALMTPLLSSYSTPHEDLILYTEYKNPALAHAHALRIQEELLSKPNDRYYFSTRKELEQTTYEIKIRELNTLNIDNFHALRSFFEILKESEFRRFIPLTIDFTINSREIFKKRYIRNRPNRHAQFILFLYDNQKQLLLFHDSFKHSQTFDKLVPSLEEKIRMQFIDSLIALNTDLMNSYKKLTSDVHLKMVDQFITSTKLAREEKTHDEK